MLVLAHLRKSSRTFLVRNYLLTLLLNHRNFAYTITLATIRPNINQMSIIILNQEFSRFLTSIDTNTLSDKKKYALSYLQSIGISINEFISARDSQYEIAERIQANTLNNADINQQF